MGQFVELPDYLIKEESTHTATSNGCYTLSVTPASSLARRNRKTSKPRSSRQKQSRDRRGTSPATVITSARADTSSFKTNRKRKRKDSSASASANTGIGSHESTRGNQSNSLRNTLGIENEEPRCARRLDIDEMSDDSDHEGKVVEAWQQGRDLQRWRGINKPGGVARVRAVELVPNKNGGKDAFYDVVYIVGAFKEKHLPAKFVRSYEINAE